MLEKSSIRNMIMGKSANVKMKVYVRRFDIFFSFSSHSRLQNDFWYGIEIPQTPQCLCLITPINCSFFGIG